MGEEGHWQAVAELQGPLRSRGENGSCHLWKWGTHVTSETHSPLLVLKDRRSLFHPYVKPGRYVFAALVEACSVKVASGVELSILLYLKLLCCVTVEAILCARDLPWCESFEFKKTNKKNPPPGLSSTACSGITENHHQISSISCFFKFKLKQWRRRRRRTEAKSQSTQVGGRQPSRLQNGLNPCWPL